MMDHPIPGLSAEQFIHVLLNSLGSLWLWLLTRNWEGMWE